MRSLGVIHELPRWNEALALDTWQESGVDPAETFFADVAGRERHWHQGE